MTLQPGRRRLLAALIGSGAVAVVCKLVPSITTAASALPPQAALLGVLSEIEGARSIGSEYLRQFPAEARTAHLMEMIAQNGSRVLGTSMTRADARQFLQRAVRQDFDQGRTVELKGWVVSRTEARLCALAAMA